MLFWKRVEAGNFRRLGGMKEAMPVLLDEKPCSLSECLELWRVTVRRGWLALKRKCHSCLWLDLCDED